MLAILQEFAGHVPQAIESARRTLPADFSTHVWRAITESMVTPVFATPILTTSWLA
jgi:serine/threonine-protein kinase HipA